MNDLAVALFITVVGMGLVFTAILLFWGAMVLLMRITGDEKEEPAAELPAQAGPAPDLELKRRAAAAAVAALLALEDGDRPRPFPLPPPVVVNTWQSVLRARQFAQRGRVR